MNEDLADEVSALNSIYGATCITPSSSGNAYVLRAPTTTPPLTLTLSFPPDYPFAPPEIVDGAGGGGVGRKQRARDVLRAVWRPGEVCLYDLVEGLRELSEEEEPAVEEAVVEEEEELQCEELPWVVAAPLVEKKSVFVARAIAVHSAEEAKRCVASLVAGNRKVAKATHNMTAYRIRREDGVTVQDNDDDGEAAAGARIAHLMRVMDVVDVLVVVSRWYGGIKLGPDRFRLINSAAREALVMGGFVKEKEKKGRK